MLTLPDLNRLKVFYVVYVNKSIVRAANFLNVTRSAVSQNLKTLEEEMQTTLFVRNSKKVLSTPAADTLFGIMSPFFQELEMALRSIETGKKHPTGHLRIGAPLDFSAGHLTEVIAAFKAKHPAVTFEMVLGIPVKQLDMLVSGQLDLAFIDNGDVFEKSHPISVETVQREEFVLACSSRFYAEHVRGNHSLKHLQSLAIVDYVAHAPVVRMWYKHHFNKAISNLRVVYSAESVLAVKKAISLGVGMGVIPFDKVEKLKVIEMDKRPLVNLISLALPLSKKMTYTEKAFISFYKSSLTN